MELHRGGNDAADALDRDPFWSVVRRRHPDLTVVLLDDDPPADPPADTPPDELDAHLARLSATWGLLASLVSEAGGPPTPPSVRWASHGRPDGAALVVERSLTGLGPDGGTDLLRRVAWRLGAHEWRMVATTEAERPVLRASDGVLHLDAEAGAVVTVLSLATPPLRLPDDDTRRAVRAALVARLAEEA